MWIDIVLLFFFRMLSLFWLFFFCRWIRSWCSVSQTNCSCLVLSMPIPTPEMVTNVLTSSLCTVNLLTKQLMSKLCGASLSQLAFRWESYPNFTWEELVFSEVCKTTTRKKKKRQNLKIQSLQSAYLWCWLEWMFRACALPCIKLFLLVKNEQSARD